MIGTQRQFETVVENTKYVCKHKKELGLEKPFIRLNTVSNQQLVTKADEDSFRKEWELLVDDILLRSVGPYGYGNEYCPLPDDIEKYRIPCRQIWRHFAILYNGDISPCCVDINGDVNLGNIQNSTLQEVWNSKEFNMLRFKHLINELDDYPMCKNCRLDWNFC